VKPLWLIISLLCMAVALVFLIRSDFDKAFILAAIGAVAWFLNYRAQMKDLITRADEQNEQDGASQSDEE
jgi:predicted component of type VI protein secretion system